MKRVGSWAKALDIGVVVKYVLWNNFQCVYASWHR
jgi:hypothetical protein